MIFLWVLSQILWEASVFENWVGQFLGKAFLEAC